MANPNMLGIYAGNVVYTNDKTKLESLKNSGISTLIIWTIHIAHESSSGPSGKKGDLSLNVTIPIASGGEYKGNIDWNDTLEWLKTGGSINRIILSIGCCGQFNKISELGTSSNGILYKNFKAIHEALPVIDAVDFDNESDYSNNATVNFANMLNTIGFNGVTFCPYEYQDTWKSWLQTVNNNHPEFVKGYNLQCYSGGGLNDPVNWMSNINGVVADPAGFVYPGLAVQTSRGGDSPDEMTSQLRSWNNECKEKFDKPMEGAWLWNYDGILSTSTYSLDDYVNALKAGWTDQPATTEWAKADNVAEYGGANWNNEVKRVSNVSLVEAKGIADNDSNINFFFYMRDYMVLTGKGSFNPKDAVFFSGKPWWGSATQADGYYKTKITWTKKADVAEYGGASWNNEIKRESNVSLAEAKSIAAENPNISYFFYVRQPMVISGKGEFRPKDAVFFSGRPWFGSAPQADSYEKNESPIWDN